MRHPNRQAETNRNQRLERLGFENTELNYLKIEGIQVDPLIGPTVHAPAADSDKGGGGSTAKEPTTSNNLSFPAIALDGFAIAPITETQFTVPYTGDYPGLTADEITYLEKNGLWYAQKTTGNTWQADTQIAPSMEPTYIDWGDNIESVKPKLRRPFRLEVTLYGKVGEPTDSTDGMTAYTMAALEYPSSSNELQGTNKATYESDWATVVSAKPKLVVQYAGKTAPTSLTWDSESNQWAGIGDPLTGFGFAPELNVGGKYIFGASQGGWKPDKTGFYRITFYIPDSSSINFTRETAVGNYEDFSSSTPDAVAEADESGVATPVIDPSNNLSYVDVEVVAGGGGKGGGKGGRPSSNFAELIELGASERSHNNAELAEALHQSPFAVAPQYENPFSSATRSDF